MIRFDFTTQLQDAQLAIEESDRHYDRYKKIHRRGCGHLIDPEPLTYRGEGTVADLAQELQGYGILDGVEAGSREELEDIDHYLAPCARTALGLPRR